MVGSLVSEKTWIVDESIVKTDVPIGPDVLCVHNINDLLCLTAYDIIQLRVRSGCVEKTNTVQCPFINIKCMKPRVESYTSIVFKKYGTRSCSYIA
jgi:hypothetical protein